LSTRVHFTLNHQPITLQADPSRNLLDVLRDDLGLTGTKQGCDHEGECGACTVLLDGQPVRACLTPLGKVAGRRVLTVEGLGSPERLHPLQQAFIEVGAVQCGYCTPGMLLAALALLEREPDPTREQIVEALEGNLCRCTGYTSMFMAVELAAARMRGDRNLASRPEPSIGGNILRADSVAKVTGQTKYVQDINMPGLLHAQVLRSPHHHARLLSLNTSQAAQLPGVARVITAADVPGENGFCEYSRGEPVLTPVGDTVNMLGAPVALVVATSPAAAQAGVKALRAEYQLLPHGFDAPEKPDADDVLNTHRVLRPTQDSAHGDLEAALAASDVLIETSYRTAFQEHAALEREAALGYLDDQGRVTVVAGTHEPHWQQEYIAAALALEPGQVRVIMPPTGGSFGGRQDPWPLVATGLMTYCVRQPVRLAYSRRESFDASPKRHPYHVHYQVGATRDGSLTGMRVRIVANTGGYDAHGYYLPDYAVMASGGPYRWQAVDAQAQSVHSNGPKSGQFRGFGAPQATFALECTLDELSEKLGQAPLELRLKNALAQSSDSFLGYPVAESLGFTEVLQTLRPRYLELAQALAEFNARENGTWRKGLGLAALWHRFGKSGSLRIEAHAELADDGRLVIYCSAPDYGQGSATAMSQLAAETLGVSRERVELVNADTALTPDSGIQGASRTVYWVGNAVCNAAQNLKQEILATAAELLDCAPAALSLVDEGVVSHADPRCSVTLQEVAQEFDDMGKSRKVIGLFDLSHTFPEETRPEYTPHFTTGAQLAEVTVDMRTGQVQVTRVVAVHDAGRAINPLDARGQVEGAILMGLGTALMEEYIPGASTGLRDYYLPTASSAPEIEVLLVEIPSFEGPFGAKGLGEPALLPTAPAIINAVSRAVGARIREVPATPERVLRAIRQRKQGSLVQ
jgi:CO/xanthine dehydrogenase Mo-binding subunit/aerobic-type carbon monoxide dehydrogenase small subunit (CoxS/CutS family)